MPDPATGDPGSTRPSATGPATESATESATTEPEDHSHDLPPATPADLTPADLTPPDATPAPAPDYDEHGTPSLDYVRDRIEGRYATSLGSTELAEDTDRVREQADQMAERDRKAADRLAEIRRSLG